MKDLWYGTDGPQDAQIVVVGEAWGEEELRTHKPFQGTAGQELNRMLAEANINRNQVLVANVVAERPQQNEMWRFFHPKDGKPHRIGGLTPMPNVIADVERLYDQIAAHPRKLVIATGNYALWALSQNTGATPLRESNRRKIPKELQTWAPTGIMSWRGSMWYIEPHQEILKNDHIETLRRTPLLPIIHPAAINRDWSQRAPTVHDLKSRVPLALENDWRPKEVITLSPPTFREIVSVLSKWLERADAGEIIRLSNDIETIRRTFISCMGFADSSTFAICIPFVRRDNPDGSFESYWQPHEEAVIIGLIRRVLTHRNIHIIGQNYIYDLQYIQYWFGVTPNLVYDTMLGQNVLFPGTPKSLEYLASLYCKYHWYWKEDSKDWDVLGDLQRLLDYNCIDVMRTWEIDESQWQYIRLVGQEDQIDFKMKTNQLCLRMMNRGVKIDKARRGQVSFELDQALNGYYSELEKIIPQSMVKPGAKTPWYRSPTQTADLFYNILGFKVVKNRKTGQPTVGKEALMQLEKWYPEFTGLFRRLDAAGSVDNSYGVVMMPLEFDGRVKCSYNPGGTETHRLASSKNVWGRGTNLQNLTVGEEDE